MDELEQYCTAQGIDAELIDTPASAKTAEDAASALNTTPEHIVKSIVCMVDGEPVLVVVRGPDRIDLEAVAELHTAEDCRLATPDEVEEITGYTVGEVPPIAIDLPKIVDEQVLQYETVYGGGGATDRVIGLDPRFIVGEYDAVEDVAE